MTITAKAKDGSNISATCRVTVNYPTIEEKLKAGDYVYYKDKNGTSRLCVVLYDSKSGYGGIQIVTRQKITTVTLGSSSFSTAKTNYNDAIRTLNSQAANYLNTTFASSARCVGSNPKSPNSEASGYYSSSASFMKSYNNTFKKEDTNYNTDYSKMSSLGILYCDGSGDNASYWLPSRKVSSTSSSCSFEIRHVWAYGSSLSSTQICLVNNSTTKNTARIF